MSGNVVDCDVAIVGGGMVGASLALALGHTRHRVALIEAILPGGGQQPSFDDRSSALGNGARRMLETLGVWDALSVAATPIRGIHISEAGRFGMARLDATAHGITAFGYTLPNRHIGAVFWEALRTRTHTLLHAPARVVQVEYGDDAVFIALEGEGGPRRLKARLAVAADGANSLVKQACGIATQTRDYHQLAVIANLRAAHPAAGIAYERFTESGPLALLPLLDGGYTVVWCLPPNMAEELLGCAPQEFASRLQRAFGWRVGKFRQIGKRTSYPLLLTRAERTTAVRTALVGNAAQSLHPVAAQGFNLGLRDVAVLAELLALHSDPGDARLLRDFAQRRADDRRAMIGFTDGLVRGFAERHGATALLRSLALLAFDVTPPAKQALSRLSWGFGRALPRLVRGLPLS